MERQVVVQNGNGWSAATFAVLALVIIAVAAVLYRWQPWNGSRTSSTTTTVSQPQQNSSSSQAGAGSSTTQSNSSSTTTTGSGGH